MTIDWHGGGADQRERFLLGEWEGGAATAAVDDELDCCAWFVAGPGAGVLHGGITDTLEESQAKAEAFVRRRSGGPL